MIDVTINTAALDRLIGGMGGLKDEVATEMASDVLGQSQSAVPVDTGQLKRSAKLGKSSGGEGRATVMYRAPHALAVEFGRGKGRQFLRKAAMSPKIGPAAAAAIARRLR